MRPQQIKCPVCSDPLTRQEWVRFVDDPRIINKFDQMNRPFRVREVPCVGVGCNKNVCLVTPPAMATLDRELKANEITSLYKSILADDSTGNLSVTAQSLYTRFEVDLQNVVAGGSLNIQDLYTRICKDLDVIGQNRRKKILATQLTRNLITLETSAEAWRSLNILQLSRFPFVKCSNCSYETCTACGDGSHHDQSCSELLQSRLITETNPDALATLKWKIENSKNCPRCAIAITREEGCFRVDCIYCGFKWCWHCSREFDEKHGFYACQNSASGSINSNSKNDVPELGVPNVLAIQMKMSSQIAKFGM
ncbi:hypothetical protein SmJEL517_g01399 [Synchytrium microbalum]|uniref:RING-type domain-containing protein n=1 Tax=Synchytrium microbalum TaxID=1806994 RepID=A0A507CG31_9FUNG|nr:uncharacterized protein SmJEL517_g01399 [Synchytrium microbalum]TPX36545.1 hypothetical protein SmJEL517_g01399 [Synchytrium microbalum]